MLKLLDTISTVLVIAPHTDDGELGCGGTIARLAEAGKQVYYLALSACEESVPAGFARDTLRIEVREATQVLGIPSERLIIAGFQVRTFDRHRQEVLDLLVRLNGEIGPQLVLIPSLNDLHQDHHTTAHEALRVFKRTTVLAYELPWNNLSFRTQCFVPLEERHVARKIEALHCYRSQQERTYIGENYVRAHLLTRGQQVEVPFAECFEVIRWIII